MALLALALMLCHLPALHRHRCPGYLPLPVMIA
jgi:hypothetical protein